MKKILKALLSAAVACLAAAAVSVCVFAETEDVDLPLTKVKTTTGSWGQSLTYDKTEFDCSRFNSDTVIEVEFELGKAWSESRSPVELILFNYTKANPQIWAKIEPSEYDETSASFRYDDILAAYTSYGGSDDFSDVDSLILGDCGVSMTATKFTVKNCTAVEVTIVSETEETTAASESETTAAETEPTVTTASETTADPAESEGGGIPLIPIVIGAVVVAVVVVVIVIVSKNKKSFY